MVLYNPFLADQQIRQRLNEGILTIFTLSTTILNFHFWDGYLKPIKSLLGYGIVVMAAGLDVISCLCNTECISALNASDNQIAEMKIGFLRVLVIIISAP